MPLAMQDYHLPGTSLGLVLVHLECSIEQQSIEASKWGQALVGQEAAVHVLVTECSKKWKISCESRTQGGP